jgi:perosamine synthetase
MSDRLAINGGARVRGRPWPPWPVLGDGDVMAVEEVMRSGGLTQLTGGAVAAFEDAFAEWHGVKHCVAMSSGTTAIHAALIALGVGPGDEVIVPAHTFIASATPVLHQGATPVFADIDDRTYCISMESVAERITGRTKAIIAVHLNGHPADMDALLSLARPPGIAVIEDAAQAHGAMVGGAGSNKQGAAGRKVGTIGQVGCFSFWEDKIITTGGEGGCVITDDDGLADRLRRIRHHGEGPMGEGVERAYYHLDLGYNYRMTSMQAATGLVQLGRLDEYLEARRRNAAYLSERLGEIDGIEPPSVADGVVHSYYKYICRLRPETGIPIGEFVRAVVAEGVLISRRYPTPLPRQPVFQGVAASDCPNAERLVGELFTLLVHPTVETRDLDDLVEAIGKVTAALAK